MTTRKRSSKKTQPTPVEATPTLAEARASIDGIDLRIQQLIAERARWAQQVGKAKGPLKA
ncbi:MAG TPA: chorismate mutase, partial [Xanthomonadaceae bacterium]|nr:chorismate mutase [Xanthomonadaceae bacterium]